MDEIYTASHSRPLEMFVAEALTHNDYTPAEALQLRALCKIADSLTSINSKMKG